MTGETALRWGRACVLAAVAVLGGLAGHVAAGGPSPSTSTVLVMVLIGTAAATPLVGEPLSTGRAAAVLVAAQGLVHLSLQYLAPALARPVADGWMPASGTRAMDPAMMHDPSGLAHPPSLAVAGGPHLLMLLAHLAAAAVVGVWLAAGERAAWTLLTLAGTSLRGLLVAVRHAASARRGGAVGTDLEPPSGWFVLHPLGAGTRDAHAVSRRGPPA
jgi:hypothetical protein